MQKLTPFESNKIIVSFLEKIKKGVKKNEILVEFFELKIEDPHYIKLDCAYIQSPDKKEGILYDAVMRRFFYLKSELVNKAEKKYAPSLFALTSTVATKFPKGVKDKMFWVCGNKKGSKLEFEDFGTQFTLTKPTK